MAYKLFWKTPRQVLCLELEGELTFDDFTQVNRAIIDQLGPESLNQPVALLIDITRQCRVPSSFAQLTASQTYMMRRDLQFILVAGSNKFMRLMIMLIYNLCRPSLKYFDDVDQAIKFHESKTAGSVANLTQRG